MFSCFSHWRWEEVMCINLFCLHFFPAFHCTCKICLHNCHNSVIYNQVRFAQILNRSQARSNSVGVDVARHKKVPDQIMKNEM